MRQQSRQALDAYFNNIARLNGVTDVSTQFAAVPTVEQTLEKHIQESSEFLKSVNFVPVDEQSGEKVGISVTTTIAGRTNTTVNDRAPADVHDTDGRGYECKHTDLDTHLKYATIDAWAKFPNFQILIRDAILRQQALDRIMIGWNGTSAAVETNRAVNTLLQDVNIGWMEKLKTEAAARYMTQGGVANEVRVGAGNATLGFGDYANLDELVHDMRSNLLAPWNARNNTFTPILSADLLDEKYFPIIAANADTPTENNALDMMLSNKKLGGLRPAEVPFMPARSIMITQLGNNMDSNLSIYHQEGTRRRHIEDNPKRSRIENYESVNEAYVIEDLSASCAAINIKLWDGAAWT